jgi:hypothetical protein
MDELGQRLERFAREGTTTTVPPGISHIRRRGHRRRQRQITGMLLGAALLTGLVLGPGRNLTRWIDNASPTAPVTRPLPESRDDRRAPVDPLIEEQGRPIPPIVVVASGVFEGKRWEYLAYRTNRGKVCGQWNRPDQVEHIRRLAPSLVIEVGGRRLVPVVAAASPSARPVSGTATGLRPTSKPRCQPGTPAFVSNSTPARRWCCPLPGGSSLAAVSSPFGCPTCGRSET